MAFAAARPGGGDARPPRRAPAPPWRSLLVALLLAPAAAPLARAQAPADTVTLTWTDTGDDGVVGTATTIDLRRSLSPITAANFAQATIITGVPAPGPAGTPEALVVRGLSYGTTYYFAMRVSDEAGNWSPLSNVAVWTWTLDTTPPAAPQGLAARLQDGAVHLTWTANTEADLAGYDVYRSATSGGPFARINATLVAGTSYDDAGPPAGGLAWYRITALDRSGNESAPGAPASVSTSTTPGIVMLPGYPNPSRQSDPVHIPVTVGTTTDGARLDILDAAGRVVRRIDLGSIGAGNQEITWDGKNDAGRLVAPGTYTVLLNGRGVSGIERLVRLP